MYYNFNEYVKKTFNIIKEMTLLKASRRFGRLHNRKIIHDYV